MTPNHPENPRPSVSVVVFAYNEEENIQPVLNELIEWLRENIEDAEVIFIDDGSSDNTFKEAQEILRESWPASHLHQHTSNKGIGASIKKGVRLASAPWVTFLPADGQVPPEAIGVLYHSAVENHADVVLSIYKNREDGWIRKLMSWGVRFLIFWVHRVRLHSDGPYIFNRELFIEHTLLSDTFFLNFEFPIQLLRKQAKVEIEEIECRPRRSGESKVTSPWRVLGVAKDLILLRCRKTE